MDRLNVGIFIFHNVEVLDFAGPYEVFSRTRTVAGTASRLDEASAPFNVFTVAESAAPLSAVGGLQVTPDHTFADAPPVDVLLIPGGMGTRSLVEHTPVIEWIRAMASSAGLVTSVCTGSLLLAKAGLLDARRATTHWGALDLLGTLGRDITVERDLRWVDDGVITSAGVSAGIDMAFYVVAKLCGEGIANETAHYIDYPRHAA
jgi:transcriptional regulator GlxA family with amidase domain